MFKEVFHGRKPIIGMVHLKALPGSPAYRGNWKEILEAALKDAEALYKGGVDGIQLENQFDKPFLKTEQIGPETTAFLTAAGCAVKDRYPEMPIGINIHLNGGIHAMAAAKACGAQWIRVFHLANGYISNSGYVDGAIIGSGFKPGGHLDAPVDKERVKRFIEVMKGVDRKRNEENISHDCR